MEEHKPHWQVSLFHYDVGLGVIYRLITACSATLVKMFNGRQTNTGVNRRGAIVNNYVNDNIPGGREEFEDWLSPLNFCQTQNDIYGKRQDGTGDWIFGEQDFKHWLQGNYRTLWCSGIPGGGKTVLASHIIDHLKQLHGTSTDVAVLFMYCNYKERTSHSVYNLVANILKQLVQDFPHIFDRVKQKFQSHLRQRFRPIVRDICDILTEEIKRFSRVFIIADALDEVTEDNNDRFSLLQKLQSLGAQLLVTSRDIESIGRALDNSRRLHIRARDDDLQRCVDDCIRPGKRLHTIIGEDTQFTNEISSAIIKHAGGMFLLCHLDVLLLESKFSRKEIRLALQNLPEGVDSAYDGTMDRIHGLNDHDRTLALWIITWIAYAFRPLLIKELQCILAFLLGTQDIDEDALIDKSIMINICVGIIAYDEEDSVFRLVHYTAQEYLNKHPERLFPNPHEHLTRISLQILSLPSLANSFNDNLALYAAQYWGDHACGSVEESLHDEIDDFLRCKDKVRVALRRLNNDNRYQSGGSALHLCAFFGLASTLQRSLCYFSGSHTPVSSLCDENDEPLSVFAYDFPANVTPLFFAAMNGHVKVVQILLDMSGADINSKNVLDKSPLITASQHGELETVKLLLARDNIDVDATNVYGGSALYYAVQEGKVDVVELLLAREDINVNLVANDGCTPLYIASGRGHTEVVKLLLTKSDASLNSTAINGFTPLCCAAQEGKVDVVELLFAREDINVNLTTNDGCTPLYIASGRGHTEVVKLLLAKSDASLNSTAIHGFTPLCCAAQEGKVDVVELLLAREDINVNLTTNDGCTPLYIASGRGHTEVVKLLLARDNVNVNPTTKFHHTPLSSAAHFGKVDVVELLLGKDDINVNPADDDGWTPLYVASGRGHTEVVKLLLARSDIKSDFATGRGYTPLSYACATQPDQERDVVEVVKLLLERDDIDVNSKSFSGWTPLSCAAGKGNVEAVRLLLGNPGVDVNAKNVVGMTPLLLAALRGHEKVMRVLLGRSDVDVDVVNPANGRSILHLAAGKGWSGTVETLLADDRFNVNLKDKFGRTPLAIAVEQGQLHIVRQFLKRQDVDANVRDEGGKTLLIMAAEHGHDLVIQELLTTHHGDMDVNQPDHNGDTALHFAVRFEHENIVHTLLQQQNIAPTQEM